MACVFVCDGCGRTGEAQQLGPSGYGMTYVLPRGWKAALLDGRDLHACSMACAVRAEERRGLAVPGVAR